ncbi:MAG: cation:proton antiporter [Calditrichia bacterium]
MKRLLLILLLFYLLMFLLTRIEFSGRQPYTAESIMALGFTLIAAYLLGKSLTPLQLPKITGYILAGIITGPYLINLLSKPVVQNLQLIDEIALSLIALTAGGEFRYHTVRRQLKTIVSAIAWQIVIVISGFILFTLLYHNYIPFLAGKKMATILGVGIIFGSLSIAKSPATTIAVITETGARGRFTDFVLGVTVFKDILVVLVFSIALSVAMPLIIPETHLSVSYIFEVFQEIAFSIGLGFLAGGIILLYLKYVKRQTAIFILGFMIFGIEITAMLHLEVILVFMVAGFFVQNFSSLGGPLIEAVEAMSLPVYVIFFAIAGASLNFPVFMENWLLAILIVSVRMATTFGGTYLGGKLTGAGKAINNYGWMGFVGQAGLTLGLAVVVKKNLPGEIGTAISTLVIGSIAINQIIGPVLFRYSLVKVGETRWSA